MFIKGVWQVKIEVNGKKVDVKSIQWQTIIDDVFFKPYGLIVDTEIRWVMIILDKNSADYEYVMREITNNREITIKFNDKKSKFCMRYDMLEYLQKQLNDEQREVLVTYFIGVE